jgi:NAD-dependent DNA ligase
LELVYANAVPRKDRLIQVCFTGFSAADKEVLIALASESQLEVVTSVTKSLAFLCAGDNAGPAKISKARLQGVAVLTREQFEHLLSTGEVAA